MYAPDLIRGSKQRRPRRRQVMQSYGSEGRGHEGGRKEGREGGKRGEEGGIVASGDPALQECADGPVPDSWRCSLRNSAEAAPVFRGSEQTNGIAHRRGRDRLCESFQLVFIETTTILPASPPPPPPCPNWYL